MLTSKFTNLQRGSLVSARCRNSPAFCSRYPGFLPLHHATRSATVDCRPRAVQAAISLAACIGSRRPARGGDHVTRAASAQPLPNPQPPREKYEVVSLGNICLDIVYPTPELPRLDTPEDKRAILRDLGGMIHPLQNWEVGGNCNFAIAAARLGLGVDVVGHWGTETYGSFIEKVLLQENVASLHRISAELQSDDVERTLVCFVLVDDKSKHAFCSRYDLGPAPLFAELTQLPAGASQALFKAGAIFTNAFILDEVPFSVVDKTLRKAVRNGASFFFDPGPRCFGMVTDSRRSKLESLIDLADVLLMTQDEGAAVTGLSAPEDMCRWVLDRPSSRTQWVVIKLGPHGAMIATKDDPTNPYVGPPLKVEVQDTVGCGDSFASGVVLGYLAGCDTACTMMLANAVGAATAMGRGAGRNVADAAKVQQLLQEVAETGTDHKVTSAAARALAVLKLHTSA